jgi:hypothetical protein
MGLEGSDRPNGRGHETRFSGQEGQEEGAKGSWLSFALVTPLRSLVSQTYGEVSRDFTGHDAIVTFHLSI